MYILYRKLNMVIQVSEGLYKWFSIGLANT